MSAPFCILLLVTVVASAPTPPPAAIFTPAYAEATCDDVMMKGGLTPDFAYSAAHRLYSLTLEDVRYYFCPKATVDNDIPTVNQDLSSSTRVLPYTPLAGSDTSFLTSGLRYVTLYLLDLLHEVGQ